MTLRLEPYILGVLENHFQLQEFLGEHNWLFDMDRGEIVFTSADSAEVIARCQVQVLGTYNGATDTWLWAWANQKSEIPRRLTRCGESIKEIAKQTNLPDYSSDIAFPLHRESHAQELAIVATGFCRLFTFYSCEQEHGALFLAVEQCPEAARLERTAGRVESVITTAISLFEFQHQPALEAFLGDPTEKTNAEWRWLINGQPLLVQFDEWHRVSSVGFDIKADSSGDH